MIYKATLTNTSTQKTSTYFGACSTTFKLRHSNHKQSFKNPLLKHQTTLSSLVWKIKDSGQNFEINWEILEKSRSYQPGSKYCNLCMSEIVNIIYKSDSHSINKRNELLNFCRHRDRWKGKHYF